MTLDKVRNQATRKDGNTQFNREIDTDCTCKNRRPETRASFLLNLVNDNNRRADRGPYANHVPRQIPAENPIGD